MKYSASIIGSHGYKASYGGWDQLVNQIVDIGSKSGLSFLIFNSKNTKYSPPPEGSKIVNFKLNAHGIQGILFDFISVLYALMKTDKFIFLGAQGFPLALLLRLFSPKKVLIVNPGGVEWVRPKFGFFAKMYLKFVFELSSKYANYFVLDNAHYLSYINSSSSNSIVIPYGGFIDQSVSSVSILEKLDINFDDYFLSVSRALEDNHLMELCESFSLRNDHNLILVSNFQSSDYGKAVYKKFSNHTNIKLIDSLYNKSDLDAVRRGCVAYIHTHTLCGSAPSLIEMIVCRKPIFSIDVPQNRFTLNNQSYFFTDFNDIFNLFLYQKLILPSDELVSSYEWDNVIEKYISLIK